LAHCTIHTTMATTPMSASSTKSGPPIIIILHGRIWGG